MKTQTMYMKLFTIICFSLLTACGPKGGGEAAPSDSGPKTPAVSPVPQTTIVVIKNSVLGDIAAYTAPGLSTDLKLQCSAASGIVYCSTLQVIP